jgi:hypothetical protein
MMVMRSPYSKQIVEAYRNANYDLVDDLEAKERLWKQNQAPKPFVTQDRKKRNKPKNWALTDRWLK